MRPKPERPKEILDLWTAGYSIPAIACKLGISVCMVREVWTRKLRQSGVHIPPGYVTLREAAKRIKTKKKDLNDACRRGKLRYIKYENIILTTMEWVQIWINNAPYRQQAQELQRKLFLVHSKPPQ